MDEKDLTTIFEGMRSCKVNFCEIRLTGWLMNYAIETLIKQNKNAYEKPLEKWTKE